MNDRQKLEKVLFYFILITHSIPDSVVLFLASVNTQTSIIFN